ncbi:hypothetical protein RFI_40047, partial [Reticulomyxa filosa]
AYCVVKLVDNNKDSNQITLLSFGGPKFRNRHTLMKYVKLNNYNKWTPFTDNHNNTIIIGRNDNDYEVVRAVIGGSNNHLLFITFQFNNIIALYSIQENKWMLFENTLPSPLFDCVAILSEEDNYIHIIGGRADINTILSTHTKTKLKIKFIIGYWIRTLQIKSGWIDDFNKIIMKYNRMK